LRASAAIAVLGAVLAACVRSALLVLPAGCRRNPRRQATFWVESVERVRLSRRLRDPGAHTASEGRQVASNLAGFLRVFANAWLEQANSYNSTKHGLTAIPTELNVSYLPIEHDAMPLGDGDSLAQLASQIEKDAIRLGEGDSLAHLAYQNEKDGSRTWSLTTRWIQTSEAAVTIALVQTMLKSLWSVARCRYGITDEFTPFALRPESFSPDKLNAVSDAPALEFAVHLFTEPSDAR